MKDLKDHWENKYMNTDENKLGWFESDLSPSLSMINECKLHPSDHIFLAGAGNSRLVDELIKTYSTITLNDISENALTELKERIGERNGICYWVDDLVLPKHLQELPPVDLWMDRAVLHFFLKEDEIENYFKLLRSKVGSGSYALFAEFSPGGAEKCSSLPIQQYDVAELQIRLGDDFTLIKAFDHDYETPSGAIRPYTYALFKRD